MVTVFDRASQVSGHYLVGTSGGATGWIRARDRGCEGGGRAAVNLVDPRGVEPQRCATTAPVSESTGDRAQVDAGIQQLSR
jgi:hypothetical protein